MEVVLCWSGFLSGNFKEEKFTAVIAEYIKIKPIKSNRYVTICGNLVGRFGWLKYNLERSLGICSKDLEEIKLAEKEVVKTIDEINRYLELIGKMYEILCKLTKPANHEYDDVIEKIVNNNSLLVGQQYEQITAGFTNTIYKIGNYVVRLCTDLNNENYFLNEIEFYKKHQDSSYIPKMYFADTTKNVVPYYYKILERIEGQTLYEIWYKLSTEGRNDIVKEIVKVMKTLHNEKVENVDFEKYIKVKISSILSKAEIKEKVFDTLLEKCNVYFKDNKLGLVHNDLHFDNLIYNNGKITLLDFERIMVGAIDYDFKYLARYKETPWLWANERTDMLAVEDDYQDLMKMFIENYDELKSINYLTERLRVYEIMGMLNIYSKYKNEDYLNKSIIKTKELLNS